MPTDAEFVRDGIPLVRQTLPNRTLGRHINNFTLQHLGSFTLGGILLTPSRERLAAFTAIAIHGEALYPALPRLNVEHLNVIDSRVVRDIHRFGNRTGDEGLHSRHQL